MSKKGKKLIPYCSMGTLICIGILFVFVISNTVFLLNFSISCPTFLNDSPTPKFVPEIHTIESSKEIVNQTHDIIKTKSLFKVAIGTVVCHEQSDLNSLEEALVLLKSTIISAIIYQTFPIIIEFHLFIEHQTDEEYFNQNMQPFINLPYEILVDIYFYTVFDAVPKEHVPLLFGSDLRCAHVRIFFPIALPQVDSILYLDTDVIITGSLAEIWENFNNMKDNQLVGAVMDIEPDNKPWLPMHNGNFENTPLTTPRGLNSGVLLMNLTKMREYQFSDKMMRLYEDYLIPKRDQTLLNALLFYNPYLLYLLPCQYNFRPTACSLGFYCSGVLGDHTGIQILHQYQQSNNSNIENAFRDIAETYQGITEPNIDLRTDLMLKVRNMYQDDFKEAYDHGECNGILNSLLFRRFSL